MQHDIAMSRMQHRAPASLGFLTEDRPSTPHDVADIFPTISVDAEALSAIHPRWKRDLYELLEHPTSSQPAFFLHVFSTFLIVFSAMVTVLETVPAFHTIPVGVWFGLETSLVALFTVEYVARTLAWSYTWKSLYQWVFSFFGIIDILAILPYYIEIIAHQDTSVLFRFSILRMFRLLRVFRPFRYNSTVLLTIEVMYLSVRRSQHALLAIGFFVVMVLTVFSTLLYFAERGTWDDTLDTFVNVDGDPTQFASIPAAAWFVLVTITTVGYGEITPRSILGRLITLPLLVFGLLLIALPSFVLGREFSLVWEKMSSRHMSQQNLVEEPLSPTELSRPLVRSSNSGRINGQNGTSEERDLSNLKLAQNQTELSRQIGELRQTVDAQGELLKKLLDLLIEARDGRTL